VLGTPGHDGPVLTDQQIAELTPDQRRDLISRLARPLHEVIDNPRDLGRRRRLRIGITAAATILLIPWILYLAHSLPSVHKVRDWDVLWVGFDAIEVALLALTFWLTYRRRLVAVLAGFATGIVLLCDAWFDVMTSAPGDFWEALLAAILLEIPLAVILMAGAFRAVRIFPAILWFSDPDTHIWQVQFPLLRTVAGKQAKTEQGTVRDQP
jgi:hypothetical protein